MMKKYFLYIAFLISIYFVGCDKPGPTELIDDEAFEVEILGKELDNEYYSNGYDTSGVTEPITDHAAIISVSGIKLTANGFTTHFSSAQTFIFDLNEPYYSPDNIILGYKTIVPGIIRFNNVQARLTNYNVRYRSNGVLVDSVLGKKYELFKRHGRILGDPFTFNYNSQITFDFNPFFSGQNTSFEIPTPEEVNGSAKILNESNNKYKIELNWNSSFAKNFYLIIGGLKVDQSTFPLYKIKTKDDGKFVIPYNLIKSIPIERFNKFSITFVRRYENSIQTSTNNIYVSSQSVHTLIVDRP